MEILKEPKRIEIAPGSILMEAIRETGTENDVIVTKAKGRNLAALSFSFSSLVTSAMPQA